jgi:hypothetical protein
MHQIDAEAGAKSPFLKKLLQELVSHLPTETYTNIYIYISLG